MQLLSKAELFAGLRALDDELKRANVRAEVFIVGGASKAIAYDARRSTIDVDAVFAPS